ncbi:MAG: carboxymuconolactone decarboxylase family protein [Methyloligellaceae bacterium]
MTLTHKEKEIVAAGISAAAGCKSCTHSHLSAAREAGATDAEIRQAIQDALTVRRQAADVIEAYALTRLGEEPKTESPTLPGEVTRIRALVALGSAFVVNWVSSLERYLASAERAGVARADILEIIALAIAIRERAEAFARRPIRAFEKEAA